MHWKSIIYAQKNVKTWGGWVNENAFRKSLIIREIGGNAKVLYMLQKIFFRKIIAI